MKISICVFTYNQEKTIASVLDFIIKQKTKYSFEIIIGEDCSTDNTKQICEKYVSKYPDKIKLLAHPKNLGLIGNFYKTISECNGKYIAICAGDDYWIDENKIEDQVEFLEKNEDYSMVSSEAYFYSFNAKKKLMSFLGILVNNFYLCGFNKGMQILYLFFRDNKQFWKRRRLHYKSNRPVSNDLQGVLQDINEPRYYVASSIMCRGYIIKNIPFKALEIWTAEHLPVILWSAVEGKIRLLKKPAVLKETTASSVSITGIHRKHLEIDDKEERLKCLLRILLDNTPSKVKKSIITQKIDSLKKAK